MPPSIIIDHAAQMLGVCRRTVYYRIREGRLRTVRTMCGSQRVLVESIVALMREEDGAALTRPGAGLPDPALCVKFPAP